MALAVSLLSGSASVGAVTKVNVVRLIAGYYGGGLLCGAAVGLLLPLARSKLAPRSVARSPPCLCTPPWRWFVAG